MAPPRTIDVMLNQGMKIVELKEKILALTKQLKLYDKSDPNREQIVAELESTAVMMEKLEDE